MNLIDYENLRERLVHAGYREEIEWCKNIKDCGSATEFFVEYTWVVICAGMKEQIARKILDTKVLPAIIKKIPVYKVYKHVSKAKAIEHVWTRQHEIFEAYKKAKDKIEFLVTLPWIGNITKYHLARNLGVDCCKPDRHLQRIASSYGVTPLELCSRLANESGDRIGVVDIVLWRAANLGWI